ncbi:hypothetical protein C9374_003776 [Naegleria lovaniensis]|uniref:RWP-RK domain-containing protein n=1 Tax=Naegleria lovaniensis TaxID=51637 RepID=A0AA88KSB4_NAELO|nr:uncharacterized protein C9374_003776 [Naegleria lovaniensis]KAG2394012.1 hypothetical protein C9374_003776 [Naegleria lovaniensis]
MHELARNNVVVETNSGVCGPKDYLALFEGTQRPVHVSTSLHHIGSCTEDDSDITAACCFTSNNSQLTQHDTFSKKRTRGVYSSVGNIAVSYVDPLNDTKKRKYNLVADSTNGHSSMTTNQLSTLSTPSSMHTSPSSNMLLIPSSSSSSSVTQSYHHTLPNSSSSGTTSSQASNSVSETLPTQTPATQFIFQPFDFKGERKVIRRRTSSSITKEEMLSVLHLSQHQACQVLGCSLSTVKRRFYDLKNEIGIHKWPKDYFELMDTTLFAKIYPLSLQFILNEKNE